MDILDQEASEDEGARRTYASERGILERPPSYEANVELSSREARYRQMLDQAAASDETVRTKWHEWEEAITRLTWDEVSVLLLIFFLFPADVISGQDRAMGTFFDDVIGQREEYSEHGDTDACSRPSRATRGSG